MYKGGPVAPAADTFLAAVQRADLPRSPCVALVFSSPQLPLLPCLGLLLLVLGLVKSAGGVTEKRDRRPVICIFYSIPLVRPLELWIGFVLYSPRERKNGLSALIALSWYGLYIHIYVGSTCARAEESAYTNSLTKLLNIYYWIWI